MATDDRRTDVEKNLDRKTGDANRDPITGAPGSHPVGTGIGAAAGGTGAAIGAVVGAVAGGLAGKGVAESVNPTDEDAYWRNEHKNRPYYEQNYTYDEYAPAYRYGWESRSKYEGRKFDEVESDLGRDWDRNRGKSSLGWEKAKNATRDAWHRVERAIPGDADRDGR